MVHAKVFELIFVVAPPIWAIGIAQNHTYLPPNGVGQNRKWEIVGAPSAPPEAGLRPPPVAAGDNSGLDRSVAMISGMYGRGEG